MPRMVWGPEMGVGTCPGQGHSGKAGSVSREGRRGAGGAGWEGWGQAGGGSGDTSGVGHSSLVHRSGGRGKQAPPSSRAGWSGKEQQPGGKHEAFSLPPGSPAGAPDL